MFTKLLWSSASGIPGWLTDCDFLIPYYTCPVCFDEFDRVTLNYTCYSPRYGAGYWY